MEIRIRHPKCTCNSDEHYTGCEFKDLDPKTAQDWQHIKAHYMSEAATFDRKLHIALDLARQAQEKAEEILLNKKFFRSSVSEAKEETG